MEHLYGLDSIRGEKNCVTFGSFDGLHIGHRAVVGRMAAYSGLQKILLSVWSEDRPVLLTESEKAFLLKDSPIDCLVSVPEKQVAEFLGILSEKHISATRRREMGDDIEGACGQLRKKYLDGGVQ